MVRLLLSIKAVLDNVTDLQPATADYQFFFNVKCTSCHEVHPKTVGFDRLEEREISNSKGNTAHFIWKCGMCKRDSSAKFDPAFPTKAYSAESNEQFTPFVILDCRGLEFIGFEPRGTWKCVGLESGTVFDNVELVENEWFDYDEKAALPVSASNMEGEWSRAPK